MRKIFVTLYFTIILLTLPAQTTNSLYFTSDWSGCHKSNASFAPATGYFSLPLMGDNSVDISSNLGLANLIYPFNSELVTFMHPSVNGEQFVSKLNKNNFLNEESNVSLFSCGFFNKKSGFWSIDISVKEEFDLNIPIDFFRLAKLGMTSNSTYYNLANLSYDNTSIVEIAVGYSQDIDHEWRIGGKAKLLVGLYSTQIDYSQFDVNLTQNSWQAITKGDLQVNSNFEKYKTNAEGFLDFTDTHLDFTHIRPAGLGLALGTSNNAIDLPKIKPAGYGVSFDFGATYKPVAYYGLTISAGVKNFGLFNWQKRSLLRGIANGNITFDGFQYVDIYNVDVDQQIDHLKKDAEGLVKFREVVDENEYHTYELPWSCSLSAEYNLESKLNSDVSVGILIDRKTFRRSAFYDIVGALIYRPWSWLSSTITYSGYSTGAKGVGIALNLSPKWINFFVASDCITTKLNRQLIPYNAFHINVEFGLSMPLWKNEKDRRHLTEDQRLYPYQQR
jgi:hypothetical protein